jgi:protein tyrosine phosphatase domain-containing protein 1
MTYLPTFSPFGTAQYNAVKCCFNSVVPTATYGLLSESIRGTIAEARLCSMFCGGKNCKYESAAKWTREQQAIEGLYSHWLVFHMF